jgi:hypothetical protein
MLIRTMQELESQGRHLVVQIERLQRRLLQ